MKHLPMGVDALAMLLPLGEYRQPGWPLPLLALLAVLAPLPDAPVGSIRWVSLVLAVVANGAFLAGYLALLIGRPPAAFYLAVGSLAAAGLCSVQLGSMVDSVLRFSLWVAAPAVLAVVSWKRPWNSTSAS